VEKTLSTDDPGFIPLVVLAAIVWVLVYLYSVDRTGVAEVDSGLLTTEQLRVESAEIVWRAKRRYEASKGRKRIPVTPSSLNVQWLLAASTRSRLIERQLQLRC
jgi:hypothetical protein